MNKRLPTDSIANELAGSSVFFPQPVKDAPSTPSPKTKPVTPVTSREPDGVAPRPHPNAAAVLTAPVSDRLSAHRIVEDLAASHRL